MTSSRLIFTWLIFLVHFVQHFQPEVKTGEHHKMLYSSRPIKTLHFTLSYNNCVCPWSIKIIIVSNSLPFAAIFWTSSYTAPISEATWPLSIVTTWHIPCSMGNAAWRGSLRQRNFSDHTRIKIMYQRWKAWRTSRSKAYSGGRKTCRLCCQGALRYIIEKIMNSVNAFDRTTALYAICRRRTPIASRLSAKWCQRISRAFGPGRFLRHLAELQNENHDLALDSC